MMKAMMMTAAIAASLATACGAGVTAQQNAAVQLAAANVTPTAISARLATTAQLAEHRAQMLRWLHEYAMNAVYPTDANGLPVSEFQDERGVRCPMAELIHRSGHDELVADVVRTNNRLRLADVHAGPLYNWMRDSGLTMNEIAMVQGAMMVDYMPDSGVALARASAYGQVRGHLATAEVALRDNTVHALADVAMR